MTNEELYLGLISELTQKQQNTKKVKNFCKQLNIPYSGDDIELMTYLLSQKSQFEFKQISKKQSIISNKKNINKAQIKEEML